MNKKNTLLIIGLMLLSLILTACRPTAPTMAPTNAPTTTKSPTAIFFSEKVDVGGYKLRIRCSGQGSPTVIVEAGLGEPGVESGSWKHVTSEIEKTTQICLYSRAGLGLSDGAPGQDYTSRTSQDMVKDLHTWLVNANVSGPYILVGHSIGGFNVRLYANQYPDEVVGMVLVDASHPDQWSKIFAVLPPEAPDEPDGFKWIRAQIDPSSNPERMDILASAAQVQDTRSLGELPLVVLTHRRNWNAFPDLPPEISAKIDQIWQNLQVDLAGLSSNSTHIIATQAGHNIQVDEPQLVIDAILKVMAEAKK